MGWMTPRRVPRCRLAVSMMVGLVVGAVAARAEAENDWRYFGQAPPGPKPVLFAPGVVTRPDVREYGSVFSKDGRSFFVGIDLGERSEIRASHVVDGAWTAFETVVSHPDYRYNDPFLSPDESRLYFLSTQPLSGTGAAKDADIWYVERTGDGWSAPVNPGPAINSPRDDYYVSFTRDGTMYLASNAASEEGRDHDFDLYSSTFEKGAFQPRRRLEGAVNTRRYEADVFVDPDERYVVFVSARAEGLGKGDLYISRRDAAGTWGEATSLGPPVNTTGHEICPFVSHDGRYLFFTRDGDIFWVDASVLAPP